MIWLALLLSFAPPFWQTKPPSDWSNSELMAFFHDSPWVQMVGPSVSGLAADPVQVYLAMPPLVSAAEKERDRRPEILPPSRDASAFPGGAKALDQGGRTSRKPIAVTPRARKAAKKADDADADTDSEALAEEYRAWREENRATQVVLAVNVELTSVFEDDAQIERMEKECIMRIGKKRVKISGHFPPTPADPYLRLAFPRPKIEPGDKDIVFELYIPGVAGPYREALFAVKELMLDGKLEM